jgi:hypothetical protein
MIRKTSSPIAIDLRSNPDASTSSVHPLSDPRETEILEDHQWRNMLGSIHNKMLLHVNADIIKNTLLTKKIGIHV